jgi:hypothetical protein
MRLAGCQTDSRVEPSDGEQPPSCDAANKGGGEAAIGGRRGTWPTAAPLSALACSAALAYSATLASPEGAGRRACTWSAAVAAASQCVASDGAQHH